MIFQASCLIGGSTNFPAYGDFMSAHVTRTYGKWWLKGEEYPRYQKIQPIPVCYLYLT